VFVEDPGAANGVLGLEARLAKMGVTSHLVATGAAGAFLHARDERFHPLKEGESARALLERVRPYAVFVGTAESPDTLALQIVDEARHLGLPSVGFVDAVSCADHRWRGHSQQPLAHCPDYLLVCDAETQDVFVNLGVPPARIQICGHPQFDAILSRRAELREVDRGELRRRLWPALGRTAEARRIVVFCGERSTGGFDDPAFDAQFRRSPDYTMNGRGSKDTRTEIIAEEVLDALTALPERPFSVLRFHPKNQPEDFGPLLHEFDATSVGGSALDLLFASDLVIGMSSMVLLEAALLGRPTLSVIARPAERDWLPALARGVTPSVQTRSDLRGFLVNWAGSPLYARENAVAHEGASSRLATFLAAVSQPKDSL
jgi:hypothetical protein